MEPRSGAMAAAGSARLQRLACPLSPAVAHLPPPRRHPPFPLLHPLPNFLRRQHRQVRRQCHLFPDASPASSSAVAVPPSIIATLPPPHPPGRSHHILLLSLLHRLAQIQPNSMHLSQMTSTLSTTGAPPTSSAPISETPCSVLMVDWEMITQFDLQDSLVPSELFSTCSPRSEICADGLQKSNLETCFSVVVLDTVAIITHDKRNDSQQPKYGHNMNRINYWTCSSVASYYHDLAHAV